MQPHASVAVHTIAAYTIAAYSGRFMMHAFLKCATFSTSKQIVVYHTVFSLAPHEGLVYHIVQALDCVHLWHCLS